MEAGIDIRPVKSLASIPGLSVSRLLIMLGVRDAGLPAGGVPRFQGFANGAGDANASSSVSRQPRHDAPEAVRSWLRSLDGLG
jgi:hypothetical protein